MVKLINGDKAHISQPTIKDVDMADVGRKNQHAPTGDQHQGRHKGNLPIQVFTNCEENSKTINDEKKGCRNSKHKLIIFSKEIKESNKHPVVERRFVVIVLPHQGGGYEVFGDHHLHSYQRTGRLVHPNSGKPQVDE